jgi:hypothetical protein
MAMRPFSDKDIERLKTTPYVKPEPLTIPAILLLIIFFPVGLYYLVRKQTPEYMLSRCKTDQEREALFAYLKTAPEVYESQPENSVLKKYYLNNQVRLSRRYTIGAVMFKKIHGLHY